MPINTTKRSRKRQITPTPAALEKIVAEAQVGNEDFLEQEDFEVPGVRVYFRDEERGGNWYLGRITEVHPGSPETTFDVIDHVGLKASGLTYNDLRKLSEVNQISLPDKPALPKSRFTPETQIQFTMGGETYRGKILTRKSETFQVEVAKMEGTTESVHFSQLTLATGEKKKTSGKNSSKQASRRTVARRKASQDIIKGSTCISSSCSDKRNPHSNLDYGNKNWWCTMWGKKSGWLTFDLGDDYLLRKVQILASNKRSAPRQCSIDYLNAAGNLMYADVLKFTYTNNSQEQDFEFTNDIPVRFVKLIIHDNWDEKYVGINRFHFHGVQSAVYDPEIPQEKLEEEKRESLEKNKRKHHLMKWELGDRIDYQWDDSGKWYTGRILHINENCTYLVKDDYNFVKDHINPEQVRQTKKRRKPRRLKASRKTTMKTIEEYMPLAVSNDHLLNRNIF